MRTKAQTIERTPAPDKAPTVAFLLEGEPGTDDVVDPSLFEQMRKEPVVRYGLDWPFGDLHFPMPYTAASIMMATFTLPSEQARSLLPQSQRLKPVQLMPGRSLINFFGAEFRRSPLGPYLELGVAVPVVVDRANPPLLPAVLEGRYPGFGAFIVELPVDQPKPCETGVNVCGYPKVVGEIDFEEKAGMRTIRVSYEGERMATFSVGLERGASQVLRRNVPTISVRDGELLRIDFPSVGIGYRTRLGGKTHLEFGDHPRFARFKNLALSTRPLEVSYLKQFNWFIREPVSLGQL